MPNVHLRKRELKDRKIIKHTDTFDLYKLLKQALGFKRLLLGWVYFFKKKLDAQTKQLLTGFEQKHN